MKYLHVLSIVLIFGVLGCNKEKAQELETPMKEGSVNWTVTFDTSTDDPFAPFGSSNGYNISSSGSYLRMEQAFSSKLVDPIDQQLIAHVAANYEYNDRLYGHSLGRIYVVNDEGFEDFTVFDHVDRYSQIYYFGSKIIVVDWADRTLLYSIDLETYEKKELNLPSIDFEILNVFSDLEYDSDQIIIYLDNEKSTSGVFVEYDLLTDQFGEPVETYNIIGYNDGLLYLKMSDLEIGIYDIQSASIKNRISSRGSGLTIGDEYIVIRVWGGGREYEVFDLNLEKITSFTCSQNCNWLFESSSIFTVSIVNDYIEVREFDILTESDVLFLRHGKTGDEIRKILWYEAIQSFVIDVRVLHEKQTISSLSWE